MASLLEIDQVGKREFLADTITNVDRGKNVLLARLRRDTRPFNTLMSWQADSWSAPILNGIVDGAPATNTEFIGDRERIFNNVVKKRRVPGVSDMAESVSNVAGLGMEQEMANQTAKAMFQIARDLECTLLQYNTDAQQDNGVNLPYLTRSMGKWGQPAGTYLPIPASYVAPSTNTSTTASASITDVIVATMMASIANQAAGDVHLCGICGPTLKRALSLLQSSDSRGVDSLRRIAEEQGKVSQVVDVIKNDFGTVELYLSFFVGLDTAQATPTPSATQLATRGSPYMGYFIDPDMWGLGYSRMPRIQPLPNFDQGPSAACTLIAGLVCNNPLTLGTFAGTS